MNLLKLLTNIKTSFPIKGRELLSNAFQEEEELLTVLISFELCHNYNISFTAINTKNVEEIGVLEAFAKVCYWLNEGEEKEAKSAFRKLPSDTQRILSYIFNRTITTSLGRDFVLDTLPKVYDLKDLYSSFIKLPKRLSNKYENMLEGINRDFNISNAKLPAAAISIPKNLRKSSKLYYYVRHGNRTHSNLSNVMIRQLLEEKFLFESFGIIFLFSKRYNKRYGKHLLPICMSKDYKSILKLYRGGQEVDLNNFEFDLKPYFRDLETPYVTFKYPQVYHIKDNTYLEKHLPSVSENNYVVFSNGLTKIKFTKLSRYEKVYDFILDEEFIPIGLKLYSGEEYMVRISDTFIEGGLENRYVSVVDTKLGDFVVRSEVYDLMGDGLFECNCCGAVTKTNLKGFCTNCYNKFKYISEYSIEEQMKFDTKTLHSFREIIGKYWIISDKECIIFKRDLELVKGKQLSLPFNEDLGV